MASLPSPSSPASPSPSASSSDNSATQPISHSPPNPQVEAGVNNGVLDAEEKKPGIISGYFDDLHSASHREKFKKYEADYSRWLTAKYFSKTNLYGGDIFDESVTIHDQVIKSSRWPRTLSYADPVQFLEEQNSFSTFTTTAETSPTISNGKHLVKKSG
ncbi:hypothetical protein D8674_029968 [Pyrus ussuriensis x Pyrus communis]|uniref:Uncharacterized protein n=1 Tax=Pyrus ussuriensis x Pyrus communis TaxID=2448454 RepID=A0A5N5I5C3_9ROSA|nr:uncharacterized protein LOC103938117 [Pyrus x bretschneideri]KAB2633721.1 hypothetical protein D8674_029968 [Pyrus ussuriensis x Pyrus communis]